jgi:transposase
MPSMCLLIREPTCIAMVGRWGRVAAHWGAYSPTVTGFLKLTEVVDSLGLPNRGDHLLTDRELERRANRRLAVLRHVEEVSFNVAATCRYYGISRQCYYGWLRRYQADGLDGLKDRSSRPHHSPRVTQAEVIEKILWLRKHYHFGPAKIAMYLAGYHDVTISTSGVWRILKRLGMNRLPASQRYQRRTLRWKRYEKQRPGHQLQVDVKFIEPLGQTGRRKKYYQFTAIDDCTRLRVLRAYPRCDQKTAIAFVDDVMSKLPFAVERIQTDNGSEFGACFHWHLLDKGVDHVRIKPRTPGSTAKSRDPTASTPKSSTDSSKAKSSTTPTSSLRSCKSGRTTTTTTALTALLTAKHHTSAFVRKPKTRCHRPSSVAQGRRTAGKSRRLRVEPRAWRLQSSMR